MIERPTIHLFQRDFRIADNPALSAAASAGPVIPLYVLDDGASGEWAMGAASRWWLHGSLASLQSDLRQRGSDLVLRRGDAVAIVTSLLEETQAAAVHMTRAHEPLARQLETRLKTLCNRQGVAFRRYPGSLLAEPEEIRSKSGEGFRVFTPFYRALTDKPPRAPLPAPLLLSAPAQWPASDDLDAWGLLPRAPDWARGLRATWTPGEKVAQARVRRMIERGLGSYIEGRDRPDRAATSMLSPSLRFGEISPRQCWQALSMAAEGDARLAAGANALLRQLAWREFFHHLLYHWPDLAEAPLRSEFGEFPWDSDAARAAKRLRAWTRGQTGYPIVDAGMRQLWETGWMHNRVRMITASFLTKHLLIHWRLGANWFWDTLVDADLANNSGGWQWVAGSGADAAPYFRIFNPVLQGQKFDPDGAYVRRFAPELARLPERYIHAPWEAPAECLAAAGVRLGVDYPMPIIDHATARRQALAAWRNMKDSSANIEA